MTFDDGILTVYAVINKADKGEKPVYSLQEKSRHYYGFDTLGFNRYYTALEAKQQIECVVNLPGWHDISVHDICELENGRQYTIRLSQPSLSEDNLRVTKLTLERLGDEYSFQS